MSWGFPCCGLLTRSFYTLRGIPETPCFCEAGLTPRGLTQPPLSLLMGTKSGKVLKEKVRTRVQKYFVFRFLPSEARTETLARPRKSWAGATQ